MNKEQRARLKLIIQQFQAFYQLVRSLSDSLGFGFESYPFDKALKLPAYVESLKEPLTALLALLEECQKEGVVPEIEQIILDTVYDSLMEASEQLGKVVPTCLEQFKGGKGKEAYTTLSPLCESVAQ